MDRQVALAALVAVAIGAAVYGISRAVRSPERSSTPTATTTEPGDPVTDRWRTHRDARATPDPAGAIRLEGRVIDAHEQPIGDAAVVISTQPPRVAHTAVDGSFAFEGLLARSYSVSAYRGDDRAEDVDVRVRPDTEPLMLHMHTGITVAVHVIERDTRAPIAGAKVTNGTVVQQRVVTGADGTAELRGLGGDLLRFDIGADGYVGQGRGLELSAEPGGRFALTVVMERGTTVRGRVIDADGKPVPRARIIAAGRETSRDAETEADAAGAFTLILDDEGEWAITARSGPGLVSAATEVSLGEPPPEEPDDDEDELPEDEATGSTPPDDLELRLGPAASITGVVVDAAGTPVAGAEILASSGDAPSSTTSGTDGSFTLLGLDHDLHQLIAREGDRAAPWQKLDLRRDDVTALKLVLADATLSGVVVDAAGKPVAGAEVGAFPSPPNIFLREERVTLTDASGRWTVGPLAAPKYRPLAAWPGTEVSFWNLPEDAPDHAPGDRDVRLVLESGATIRGVVTRGGAPVRRFAVQLARSDRRNAFEPILVADDDGHFELHHLRPGDYELVVVGVDFARMKLPALTLAEGEVEDVGTIEVAAGRTLHGRVVDEAGAPVADATVIVAMEIRRTMDGLGVHEDPLRNAVQSVRTAVTDADGAFTLAGLDEATPTPLHAIADRPGVGRSLEVAVPAGDAPLVLTVLATGGVAVTVEGAPSSDQLSIDVQRVDNSVDRTGAWVHDAGGVTRLGGLTPGAYEVRAITGVPRRYTRATTVEVSAHTFAGVTVRFPTAGVILVVTPPAGCKGAVLALPGAGEPDLDTTLAEAFCYDTFELAPIEPGDYRLCVEDGACRAITVTAAPDRQAFTL